MITTDRPASPSVDTHSHPRRVCGCGAPCSHTVYRVSYSPSWVPHTSSCGGLLIRCSLPQPSRSKRELPNPHAAVAELSPCTLVSLLCAFPAYDTAQPRPAICGCHLTRVGPTRFPGGSSPEQYVLTPNTDHLAPSSTTIQPNWHQHQHHDSLAVLQLQRRQYLLPSHTLAPWPDSSLTKKPFCNLHLTLSGRLNSQLSDTVRASHMASSAISRQTPFIKFNLRTFFVIFRHLHDKLCRNYTARWLQLTLSRQVRKNFVRCLARSHFHVLSTSVQTLSPKNVACHSLRC